MAVIRKKFACKGRKNFSPQQKKHGAKRKNIPRCKEKIFLCSPLWPALNFCAVAFGAGKIIAAGDKGVVGGVKISPLQEKKKFPARKKKEGRCEKQWPSEVKTYLYKIGQTSFNQVIIVGTLYTKAQI